MDAHDPGLDALAAVADQCKTSLTATAIRYAELADSAVAVIMSSGGVVDYCFLSEAMKSLRKRDFLRKGSPVPAGTATAQLAGEPARVLAGTRVADELDVREWLGGSKSVAVSEQSIGLGRYGKIVTMLIAPDAEINQEMGDADEETDLIESWTPRFR